MQGLQLRLKSCQELLNVFTLEVKVKVNGRKLSWEAAINILHSPTLLSSRGRNDKLPSTSGAGGRNPPSGPEPSQLWASAHPAPEGPGVRSDVLPVSVRQEAGPVPPVRGAPEAGV